MGNRNNIKKILYMWREIDDSQTEGGGIKILSAFVPIFIYISTSRFQTETSVYT